MEFGEYYRNKAFLLAADLLALAILCIGFIGSLGNSVGSVIFYVLKVTVCIILSAIIFWLNHGGGISAAWVDCLLWPRRFLQKAPPPLSQAQALIVRGKYEDAETLLNSWHREYPESAHIALALFELLVQQQRYEEALQKSCETLSCRFRSAEEEAVPLLEKSVELFCSADSPEKALALLAQEGGKKRLYAPLQLQYIKQLENSLKKRM